MENDMEEQLIQCENCQRSFPTDRIQLHEAYCTRNFRKCPKCGTMIDKNYMDDHDKQYHAKHKCKYCEQNYEGSKEQEHLISCLKKPQYCQYCENIYPKNIIANHLQVCGARTKQCQVCNKPVNLKDYQVHLIRCKERKQRKQKRQSSQNPRNQDDLNHLIAQRQLYRQNSTNQIHSQPLNFGNQRSSHEIIERLNSRQNKEIKRQSKQKRPRVPKTHKKIYIQPQQIKPKIDPVPISVRIAMKIKQNRQHRSQRI